MGKRKHQNKSQRGQPKNSKGQETFTQTDELPKTTVIELEQFHEETRNAFEELNETISSSIQSNESRSSYSLLESHSTPSALSFVSQNESEIDSVGQESLSNSKIDSLCQVSFPNSKTDSLCQVSSKLSTDKKESLEEQNDKPNSFCSQLKSKLFQLIYSNQYYKIGTALALSLTTLTAAALILRGKLKQN